MSRDRPAGPVVVFAVTPAGCGGGSAGSGPFVGRDWHAAGGDSADHHPADDDHGHDDEPGTTEGSEEETPWGWIAFGALAVANLAFGLVWFLRRRRSPAAV